MPARGWWQQGVQGTAGVSRREGAVTWAIALLIQGSVSGLWNRGYLAFLGALAPSSLQTPLSLRELGKSGSILWVQSIQTG